MRYGNARPDLRHSNVTRFLTLTRPKPEKTSSKAKAAPSRCRYPPPTRPLSPQPPGSRARFAALPDNGPERGAPSRAEPPPLLLRRWETGPGPGPPLPAAGQGAGSDPPAPPCCRGSPGAAPRPLVAAPFDLVWLRLMWRSEPRSCSFGCLRPPERWDPQPRGALLLSELQHTCLRGKRQRHHLATRVFETERAEEGETLKAAPSVIWSLFRTHFSPHEFLAMSRPPAPSSYFIVSLSGISYEIPLRGYKSLTLQQQEDLEKQGFSPTRLRYLYLKCLLPSHLSAYGPSTPEVNISTHSSDTFVLKSFKIQTELLQTISAKS